MAKKINCPPVEFKRAKAMVRRIVEHHLGSMPTQVRRTGTGLSNLVFSVAHAEGDLVVRMCEGQGKVDSYVKEQWATARAREAGVPVPEVLEVGSQVVPHAYMISRKSSGREATIYPDRMPVLREMGRYAAIINSIPTEGFGSTFDWSHNRLSHNASWEDFLRSELKLDERIETLESRGMLAAPRARNLRSILENAAGKRRKPFLNHGDIRLKNVLVDDAGRITSILDWENCTSNLAPEWEMSLALHDLSIDEKDEFIAGYGLNGKTVSETAPVVKALTLINYAPEIERIVKSKDSALLERYRTRLSGALDLYSL